MSADAPQFGDVLGAQVREKVDQKGCDLSTVEAVAFLRAVGMEPTANRVLAAKMGMELGILMSASAVRRAMDAAAIAHVARGTVQ